jgi:hypothetical protein
VERRSTTISSARGSPNLYERAALGERRARSPG